MFIRTRDNGFINADNVLHIREHWNKATGETTVICHMTDGTTIDGHIGGLLDDDDLNPPPVIPAEPGYTLLAYEAADSNGPEFIQRSPVIAWALDMGGCGFHRPISLFAPGSGANTAVLCPDGRCIEPGDSTWPNEQAWLDNMREMARSKAKPATEAA